MTEMNAGILFGDIAAEWFQMIKPQVKESTQNKYQNLLESYILTAFGETSLCHMTHPFIGLMQRMALF
ncbi:MAG: hypothetical protein ACLSFZ_00930 [Frisingicoccus sp.]